MSDNNHMDEFDLQIRSIMENCQEDVPGRVWDGVSAGLDKAARAKVVSLWFRRAGLSVAAAAAVVAGFIFIDSENATDLVSPVSDELIAVTNEPVVIRPEVVEESSVPAAEVLKQTGRASMIADAGPTASSLQSDAASDQETVHEETVSGKSVSENVSAQKTEDIWIEEKEPKKRKINTSLVISGIAGTNSPSSAAKAAIFRSPALDRAPTTTIVQQTGSEITYGIPVSVGLGAKINLTRRWAVSAGVNYTLLTSRFDGKYINVNEDVIVSVQSAEIRNTQHYIGIPVSAYYDIIEHDFINFYAHFGGAIEKCIQNKYEVRTSPTVYHTQSAEGVQLSANAGIGVEFMLGKHIGVYLDPSLRYYFRNNQPKSIRTAQPLMLGFEAGLRFNL